MPVVLARYCYRKSSLSLSVSSLSVRLSVTSRYRWHIGWTSSKVITITRVISLGLRSTEPQHRQSGPRGIPPKFGWNRGGGRSSQQKTCNISETRQDRTKVKDNGRPRLLLTTNRKSHTHFRLIPNSVTLDDLEGPLRALFQNTCVFRSQPRKFEKR